MGARRAGVLLALLPALVLSGCPGGGAGGGENARKGGSITLARALSPPSLDPALAADRPTQDLLWSVYTPPLTLRHSEGSSGTTLAPALLSEMPDVSTDGRTWTLTLRRGLRFSNGRRLRASDVLATLMRTIQMRSRGSRLFGALESGSASDRERTVILRLRAPDGTFGYALASTYAGVVPKGTPARHLGLHQPPGIGPYRITRVTRDGGISMVRRRRFQLPNVPGGNVDRIDVDIVASLRRQAGEVIDGRLDVMLDPAPAPLLPEIRSTYRQRYRETAGVATRLLVFDSRARPFDDFRVRQAVNLAIDSGVVGRLLDGRLQPGCTVLPPAVAGHRMPDPCPWGDPEQPGDLRRAAGLIQDAGAGGERMTLRAGSSRGDRLVGSYLARLMRKLGLRARLAEHGPAQATLIRLDPAVPHPAAYLRPRSFHDTSLVQSVARLTREVDLGKAASGWAAVDSKLVERARVAPLGYDKQPTFLSSRMDAQDCLRVQPMYGADLSSLCLR